MYIKIRNLIRTITDNSKFNLDDNLPLKKTLELRNMVIVFRSVFHEDHKYYPKVFIDECLYNYKRYILIELTFLIISKKVFSGEKYFINISLVTWMII